MIVLLLAKHRGGGALIERIKKYEFLSLFWRKEIKGLVGPRRGSTGDSALHRAAAARRAGASVDAAAAGRRSGRRRPPPPPPPSAPPRTEPACRTAPSPPPARTTWQPLPPHVPMAGASGPAGSTAWRQGPPAGAVWAEEAALPGPSARVPVAATATGALAARAGGAGRRRRGGGP
jgi:hypothetical protein